MATQDLGVRRHRSGLVDHANHTLKSVLSLRSQVAVRVPSVSHRPLLPDSVDSTQAEAIFQKLKRDGVAVLPSHFTGEQLDTVQRAFNRVIDEAPLGEEIPDSLVLNDFFSLDPSFIDLALDDTLLHVISRYYRRPFFLGRAMAMRLLPCERERYGSFQWHHDTRGRQVKLMVLLSDVGADGQAMLYHRGTQDRFYTYDRMYGPGSRFEDEYASRPVPSADKVEVCGPAGTVALFDTNGLHCGNRKPNGTRDTITYDFTTGYNVRSLHYRAEDLDRLPLEKRKLLTANPKHQVVG